MVVSAPTEFDDVLFGYHLALLSSATKYNLDDRRHRRHSHKTLVSLFFRLIEIIGIDLFVECGAKEASASRRMKKRNPTARVVAFEANPYTHAEFQSVNSSAGVEYLHLALSDRSGPVTFNVHKDEAGAPIANGQASLLKRRKAREDITRGFVEATVAGITLDEFFSGYGSGSPALWIDVEGACGLVLPGARELLSKSAVLIVEVEEQRYWGEEHWLQDQVFAYLYHQGFVPVARDYEYEYQYNVVFVRSDRLVGSTRIKAELARFMSQAYPPPQSPALDSPGTSQMRPVYQSAIRLKAGMRRRLRPVKRWVNRTAAQIAGKL